MSAAEDVAPADVVPRRSFVPSEREVEGGLAEYTFSPLPPPPPREHVPIRRRVGGLLGQLDPRGITAGYSALPIGLLSAYYFFTYWDDAAFAVLLPEIRDEFGFDVGFLLALTATVGIITQLIAPVMGFVADRVRRVRMVGFGGLLANSASMVAGIAPTVPTLAGARATSGLGVGVANPALLPLVTDWYPLETRARLFAFVGIAGSVGSLVGPTMAGGLGSLVGWRGTMVILGGVATLVSLAFFVLKEPPRGLLDRKSLGASDEVAAREQAPVSWAEGWRAAASIQTLRRLWFATPFLIASSTGLATLIYLYYAESFGLSGLQRGLVGTVNALAGVIGLTFAGPIVDRLLIARPGRLCSLIGGLLAINSLAVLVMAVSPSMLLSILVGIPLGASGVMILPAIGTLGSIVVPARYRSFGMGTTGPWQVMGLLLLIAVGQVADSASVRGSLLLLVPVYLIGAAIVASAGASVERDMRAARAAAMADEAAQAARERGGSAMVICRDVDVSYDGTQVLFNVDFDVEEGELVALLGTNGAGKSTLLRAIAGIQEASNGAIFLDGNDVTHRPPHQNARDGIVFMPGGRAVFPSLSVAENLRAATWMYRGDQSYVTERTAEVLDLFPALRDRLDQEAGSMSGGEQQMLALGQAFLMKPRLLMIDELSLGLAPAVVERLLDIVRRINAQGTTVLLVEQSANVALTVAQRAVFMEKGEIRFDGSVEQLLARGDLLRSVFLAGAGGGQRGAPFIAASGGLIRRGTDEAPEEVLSVDDVQVSFGGHHVLRGAHVHVTGGDVVGIVGPNGAGKTTLFDVISGYVRADEGRVAIAGTDATGLGPDARARLGLSRSFQNARLFPALTVRENVAVALEQKLGTRSALAAATWLPIVRRSERRAARRVDYLIDLLNLEAYADKFVSELSTGSRRMVDIACVMASEPRVLLLDEPSSGLAQAEVELLGPVVRRLARETGCGVLVIEHDIPLITALADRLVAMELGTVVVEGDPATVMADPRVIEAYLGADPAVINRSGGVLAKALAAVNADTPIASIDPELRS